jgi:hypothetical protein
VSKSQPPLKPSKLWGRVGGMLVSPDAVLISFEANGVIISQLYHDKAFINNKLKIVNTFLDLTVRI